MNSFLLVAVAVLIIAVAASGASARTLSPVVETKFGKVQGWYEDNTEGVYSFKSIPYAQAPVGKLRFQPPQLPIKNNSDSVFMATEFGPGCMAPCSDKAFPRPDIMCPWKDGNLHIAEDCLSLSVYTPTLDPNANLTTMLFMHGGNYKAGSGGVPLYDGSSIAKHQGVIVVAINYRLGFFGAAFSGGALMKGNQQTLDQRMAMQWVKATIRSFGGSGRLMIFGQSAGAASVTNHLISPGSWPFYDAAYILSNPLGIMDMKPDLAISLTNVVAKNVSCSDSGGIEQLECLQKVPAAQLLEAQETHHLPLHASSAIMIIMEWLPVVDGDVIPLQPVEALTQGKFNKNVPITISTVANESLMFLYDLSPKPLSKMGLDLLFEFVFDNTTLVDNIVREYGPIPNIPDERHWASPCVTDYLFAAAWDYAGREMVKAGAVVYQVMYDFLATWNKWTFEKTMPYCVNEVCHAQDLPMYFDPFAAIAQVVTPPAKPGPAEQQLVQTMQTALGNFAKYGNANMGKPLPADVKIPLFKNEMVTNFSVPVSTMHGYREGYYSFWQKQGFVRF